MSKKKLRAKWLAKLKKHKLYCYLCGELICCESDLTADHIKPKSKGGANADYNLMPAHKHCNELKADMSLQEFQAKRILRVLINQR
jgi:5-methylcytosine-specific restriction endonuclease McrA